MTITELAIKRPSFVIVIFLSLALLAIFGYTKLSYELLPNINTPYVVVSTVYMGASPPEVESTVTRKIEDVLSGIDNIKTITSTSYEGLSVIVIEFNRSANVDFALQDVQRKVNSIISDLPKTTKTPSLSKYSLNEMPVLKLIADSKIKPTDFHTIMNDKIIPEISRIDGVGQVNLVGSEEREIKINIDAQKVSSFGLSMENVVAAVNMANMDFPTGKLKKQKEQFVVRVAGKFSSVDEMNNLVVGRSSQGGDIMLKDISEIEDGKKDITTITRYNGVNAVGVEVLKQTTANVVKVSREVKEALKFIEEEYQSINLHFEVANDQSEFTIEAANAVMDDLMLAIILVALVMFIFLHSIRTSLVVMVSIPCSLTTAFVVMWIAGYSLNLFTLLALSLVIGILVDDSIVVIENIYHHLEKGEDKLNASIKGRNEIGFAAVSITFVDVVVFVPLALVSGLIGDIIHEFAVVVLVSTLTSLFVSFTVTPALASRFAKLEDISSRSFVNLFGKVFEKAFKWITNIYLKLLDWALHNQWKSLIFAFSLLIASFCLPILGYIGTEFMKQSDRSQFSVSLELAPGTTLEQTNKVSQEIERIIAKVPDVINILTNVGVGHNQNNADNEAQFVVSLTNKEERKKSTTEIGNEVKKMLQQIPGAMIFVNQIGFTGDAGGAPIQIEITGTSMDSLQKTADYVADALRKTPGIIQLKFSSSLGNPETKVEIDRQKMASFGLTVNDIGTILGIALTGNDDSKYREGSNEYPIRIQLDEFDRTNPDDLAHLTFFGANGKAVELQQFAKIYQGVGPTKLERKDKNSLTSVFAYTDGSPSGSVLASFNQILKDKRAEGTKIGFGGDQKEMIESFINLFIALLTGIIAIYFVMVLLYNSFAYPFVVLFSIPLALIGALSALALTNNTINVFSIIGMIMMTGLVAKNAILIVDRANEKRAHGLDIKESLIEAGESRIRPIMMTTMAMVIGMLPIATASGAGAEWKNGLAWALIGGLLSSMFLTLIIVPIIYNNMALFLVKFKKENK